MGRPPKYGPVKQTDAERQQRSRANRKGALPTIDVATIEQCFRDAIGKTCVWEPKFDRLAELISLHAMLREWPTMSAAGSAGQRIRSWHSFAWWVAMLVYRRGGMPRSLKADAPLCVFVHGVMRHLGISKTRSAISAVIRGKRGRQPHLKWRKLRRMVWGTAEGDTNRLPPRKP